MTFSQQMQEDNQNFFCDSESRNVATISLILSRSTKLINAALIHIEFIQMLNQKLATLLEDLVYAPKNQPIN